MPRFVVQEHHATRLHWDFRLEMEGVLKSWAVPKGPPTEPGVKRLAIEVDDHPLDYVDFKGVIAEGYGAGTVDIWDEGTYEWESREGKLYKIVMAGSKLKGRFKMVFTGYGGGNGWLLIKSRDDAGGEAPAKKSVRKTSKKSSKKRKKK